MESNLATLELLPPVETIGPDTFPLSSDITADAPLLRSLVHHNGWVAHDAPLEAVQRLFVERQVEYLALVREGHVSGLCSRSRVGQLFGSRYGFSLYSRAAAHLAQVTHPLVFTESTPLTEILERSLARPSETFQEDVALVDEHHALIGLVPVDALARLQSRLVAQQVSALQESERQLLRANQALRESQGRYFGLFDSPAMGVALLDHTGAVHAHNRRLAELLGTEAEGSLLVSLGAWLTEPDRTAFAAVLESIASRVTPAVAREFRFEAPGRGSRQFRAWLGWIEATQQICACFDDVTEQRALERNYLRQEKQALLDTLVGGIAHELNNKLTPVQGFSELIVACNEENTRAFAELIGRSVAEASHIIRQLLQLSKPTRSALRTIDLRTVVADAVSMLRFQIREVRCVVETTTPPAPVWVEADPAELKQVVMNLGLNALQAMETRAGALLRIELETSDADVRLAVSDNGVGIPSEHLDRIFDPFFTTKSPEKGSGLGLSVCFSIVQQHGGRIEVSSVPGEGARFIVSLPRHHQPPVAIPAPAAKAALAAAAVRDARVLVVDDEPHVRRLIQTVLTTRFECDVDTAGQGVEAFERLATQRYTLVISDIRMPTMNGTELHLWLREAQPELAKRFIFVTGFPGENHLEEDIAAWKIPVIAKPFSIAQLCATCAPFLAASEEERISAP